MWLQFGVKDLIDILLVAFFLYKTYQVMKTSGTLAIFSGVVSFIVVWILISHVLEMKLMGAILDKFISVGFVVLVVLFQDEIRRFLLVLGSHRGWKFLSKLFSKICTEFDFQDLSTDSLSRAARDRGSVASQKTSITSISFLVKFNFLTSFVLTRTLYCIPYRLVKCFFVISP